MMITRVVGTAMPILILAVGGIGHAATPPTADLLLPCIPPLVASPARCTFNIYGTITDQHGNPIPNVAVSKGTPESALTDSEGFYDLYIQMPGTYTLRYSHPRCSGASSDVLVHPREALLDGGTRNDVTLICQEVAST